MTSPRSDGSERGRQEPDSLLTSTGVFFHSAQQAPLKGTWKRLKRPDNWGSEKGGEVYTAFPGSHEGP